jgi:hypothetical protein
MKDKNQINSMPAINPGADSCKGQWVMEGSDPLQLFSDILHKCICHWLCVPRDNPVIWSGNYRNLPSTTGKKIHQGGEGLKTGDTCLCKKPGPEYD